MDTLTLVCSIIAICLGVAFMVVNSDRYRFSKMRSRPVREKTDNAKEDLYNRQVEKYNSDVFRARIMEIVNEVAAEGRDSIDSDSPLEMPEGVLGQYYPEEAMRYCSKETVKWFAEKYGVIFAVTLQTNRDRDHFYRWNIRW